MPLVDVTSLDAKIRLAKDYLANKKASRMIPNIILAALNKIKKNRDGSVIEKTVSPIANAFMLSLVAEQLSPIVHENDKISEYSTIVQKSLNFEQTNIETENEFDEIFKRFENEEQYLFRGQRESKWMMYSTLQRAWILNRLESQGNSYQKLLEDLVQAGRGQYRDLYLGKLGQIHDDADNDVAVLGFLQHHGCPTPLLDWTRSFKNSLFFALDGLDFLNKQNDIDEYMSVYFVNEKDFEKGGMREIIYHAIEQNQDLALNMMIDDTTEDEERRLALRNHFKGRKAIDLKRIKGSGLIAYMLQIKNILNFPASYFGDGEPDDIIFSIINNEHILNQKGVFSWNADPTKPFEVVVNEQGKLAEGDQRDDSKQYSVAQCFNIRKDLKDYISEKITKSGITKENIYATHDLDTRKILEMILHKR